MFQKKGVGTRRLKYRLPENPGILNSPHTSVRGNGLSRAIHIAYISQFREQMANWRRRTCKVIVISALKRA